MSPARLTQHARGWLRLLRRDPGLALDRLGVLVVTLVVVLPALMIIRFIDHLVFWCRRPGRE